MHPTDNVVVVATPGGLKAGTPLQQDITLREEVPPGHKVSVTGLNSGDPVRRYGVVIGHARQDLAPGSWINEARLSLPGAVALDQTSVGMAPPQAPPAIEGFTFQGYRNADGSVGTRNILAISTTVQCVSGVVDHAVQRIRRELLPQFPHVDDVVALEHAYGCGVAIDAPDAAIPIRTLRNLSRNPNFGGEVMIVSLGCEKLQPERLLGPGGIPVHTVSGRQPPTADTTGTDVVCLQDEAHVGFQSMIDSIMATARVHLQRLEARRRETCPASSLVVGMQCGGSDAFSGITANPAVGVMSDLLIGAGATVLFSETSEVRDAVTQLVGRAATADVADAIRRELAWYDAYLSRGGADRSANTTPGNKRGGLANIVEKAMGSVTKSGSAPIQGVLGPGEHLRDKGITRGLVFAATPASDFICGTLQLAAGMNLHVFTTGRGTPYGLAQCPVVKVATRTDLARRWHDLMDWNAGRIVDEGLSLQDAGMELFRLLLDVASGTRTWTEHWKLSNELVLFNPAPVT